MKHVIGGWFVVLHSAPDPAALNKIVAGLSAQQKAAVLTRSCFSRIVAGAGAGKTETLTRRIVDIMPLTTMSETVI